MMFRYLTAFLCGVLFSAGLVISQMVDPQKVLAFLDILGDWDPSLLVVMSAALAVYWVCYFVIKPGLQKPILTEAFILPENTAVDRKLILGAILFGLGWGMSGLCPGPAIANLSSGNINIILYVATMLISMFAYDVMKKGKNL